MYKNKINFSVYYDERNITRRYTMQIYKVVRPKSMVYVSILRNKTDGTYSFVNLSKGHICPCRFRSEEEALQDLEKQKEKGNVISYEITQYCNRK